ncbi:MAG: FtsX-like permease family protein [Patescibacteria group bacterium]|nr:FtsX-like permease family protein [Patescibacteria group bacterium]
MQSIKTAFFIAYKSIVRGHKSTLAFIIFVLSLSFFNAMFIPGIFSGLLETIIGLEVNTSTADIVVTPQQAPVPKEYIQNEQSVQARIGTIPGVIGTTRTYLSAASLSYDKDKNGVYKHVSAQIIGIDPTESAKTLNINKYLVAGSPLSDTDTDQIVISAALAGGYGLPVPADLGGVKVGDKINVVYANEVARQYTVKGIVNITFGTALSNTYITAKEAESVLSTSNQASQILVKVDDAHSLAYYKQRVQEIVPALQVRTYQDLLAVIQSVLDAFTLIALIVSIISILVATITIFVMIYINAMSKRREIGILKAIGIRGSIIVYSYIFQALFYVLCGAGIGLAFIFGVLLPYLSVYPIQLPFGPMIITFGATLITETLLGFLIAGFFSGLIPSRIVTRQKILKSIWG